MRPNDILKVSVDWGRTLDTGLGGRVVWMKGHTPPPFSLREK